MSSRSWIVTSIPFVLWASAGCGPSDTYHGATAFSAEERAEIESAVLEAADRTGGEPRHVVWDNGDDGDNRILRAQPPDPKADGQYLMSSQSYARTIYIRPNLPTERTRRAALHEFLHSYGLCHHNEVGVMDERMTSEWSEADERECVRVGMCR